MLQSYSLNQTNSLFSKYSVYSQYIKCDKNFLCIIQKTHLLKIGYYSQFVLLVHMHILIIIGVIS